MSKVSSGIRRALRLSLCIVASSLLVAASPQQQTTTQTRKAPQLSPEEKEAQKHYRIAQEALKNNDLNTASDELKTASTLAPNNALIWYNLAVVESKSDNPDSALEHLHKATRLGLPATQQDDADQLEAKLSYATKKHALSLKIDKLARMITQTNFRCDAYSYSMITNVHYDGSVVGFDYDLGPSTGFTRAGSWQFNLTEFDPTTVSVIDLGKNCHSQDWSSVYKVAVRPRGGAMMTGPGTYYYFENPLSDIKRRQDSGPQSVTADHLEFWTIDKTLADDLAKLLSETIEASGGKH